MDEKTIQSLLVLLFLVLQFIFIMILKRRNSGVIDAINVGNDKMITACGDARRDFENHHHEQDKVRSLIHSNVETIKTIISTPDPDGNLLVFTPRSWQESQKEIVTICRDITETQKSMQNTQESMLKAIEKIVEKQNDRRGDFP